MSRKATRNNLDFDPTIENPKSKIQNRDRWSRREFLNTVTLAGTAALLGFRSEVLAAEPPPETMRLRIPQIPSTCRSPEWIAEELLRIEGFTDVQYVPAQGTQGVERALASGEADLGGHFAAPVILRLEAGDPVVMLGGEHIGCFELLGSERIRTIRDLKGRAVAIPGARPQSLCVPREHGGPRRSRSAQGHQLG